MWVSFAVYQLPLCRRFREWSPSGSRKNRPSLELPEVGMSQINSSGPSDSTRNSRGPRILIQVFWTFWLPILGSSSAQVDKRMIRTCLLASGELWTEESAFLGLSILSSLWFSFSEVCFFNDAIAWLSGDLLTRDSIAMRDAFRAATDAWNEWYASSKWGVSPFWISVEYI